MALWTQASIRGRITSSRLWRSKRTARFSWVGTSYISVAAAPERRRELISGGSIQTARWTTASIRCRWHCVCHSSPSRRQDRPRRSIHHPWRRRRRHNAALLYRAAQFRRARWHDSFNPGADSLCQIAICKPTARSSSVALEHARWRWSEQRRATISGGLIRTVRWTSLSIPV